MPSLLFDRSFLVIAFIQQETETKKCFERRAWKPAATPHATDHIRHKRFQFFWNDALAKSAS